MVWRRISLMCVMAGSVLVMAGCGGSSEASAPAASTTAAVGKAALPTTTIEATTPAPTTTPPTTTAAATTTLTDVQFERNESYYFTSPSGDFQCGIIKLPNRTEAGCEGVTSPIPPRPDSCMVSWGNGIRVENEGEGAFMCSGGLVYTSGGSDADPVLPPGSTLSKLGYTCKTTATAVTCVNDDTTHGFTVAAGSNETF